MSHSELDTELLKVPIGTFRHYIDFIVTHDLWDEATAALETAAGSKSVLLGAVQTMVIRDLVDTRGAQLNDQPEHAGALVVPECGCDATVARPPKTSHDAVKTEGADAGADAGTP
ncbi:hypothetical protein [Tsukamurella sp. NPDC003166]|uniref:hypothetical protein n=1 Tax=Tsukamurella sp. NPDC003166 TaxID=3154444 RepID=UPI00339E5732